MPKKGKKSKVPLSDEEQLLLFQQKLLAEEEAAKKKERLLTQFLKVMLVASVFCPNPAPMSWRRCLGRRCLGPCGPTHFHPARASSEVLGPEIHGLQATLFSA